MSTTLGPHDALVLVDVQNDFLPGGRLAISGGDAIVPVLNEYMRRATGIPVFASRDWHPPGHCSFRERGGPWPPHCVQGTPGAEIAPGLRLPSDAKVVFKGMDPERDAYSAFEGTTLNAELRRLGVTRILVGGLATDHCVLRTVLDAKARGYTVVLLEDAIRGVDAGRSRAAREDMLGLGVLPATLEALYAPESREPRL